MPSSGADTFVATIGSVGTGAGATLSRCSTEAIPGSNLLGREGVAIGGDVCSGRHMVLCCLVVGECGTVSHSNRATGKI